MRNNALKTKDAQDSYESDFPWTDDECRALGVDRQLAHLAWEVVNGLSNEDALVSAGYLKSTSFKLISCLPNYLHAMRVMATQYLNAVAFPRAVVALIEISGDRNAQPAARVKASNVLMDYASSTLAEFKADLDKNGDDMSPEAIDRAIKQLQVGKVDLAVEAEIAAASVHFDGQTPLDDTYLTDMS